MGGGSQPEATPPASTDLETILKEVNDRIVHPNQRSVEFTAEMLAKAVPVEGTIEEKVRALHRAVTANELSLDAVQAMSEAAVGVQAMRNTAARAVQAHVRGRLSRNWQTPPIPSLEPSSVACPSMYTTSAPAPEYVLATVQAPMVVAMTEAPAVEEYDPGAQGTGRASGNLQAEPAGHS